MYACPEVFVSMPVCRDVCVCVCVVCVSVSVSRSVCGTLDFTLQTYALTPHPAHRRQTLLHATTLLAPHPPTPLLTTPVGTRTQTGKKKSSSSCSSNVQEAGRKVFKLLGSVPHERDSAYVHTARGGGGGDTSSPGAVSGTMSSPQGGTGGGMRVWGLSGLWVWRVCMCAA